MAVKTNKEFAEKIGINQSVAITCVKPSGIQSHSWLMLHLVFMHGITHTIFEQCVVIRKTPWTKMMVDQGFPVEDDAMNPSHIQVFSFPMKVDQSAYFVQT